MPSPTQPGRPAPAALLGLVLLAGLLAGCGESVGPGRLRTDQPAYADAISEATKQQTLLNLVKLHYGDNPSFIAIEQLVAGYNATRSASLGAALLPGSSFEFGDDGSVGVGGSFSESPSITYRPLSGGALSAALLTPLRPTELFQLVSAGPGDDLALLLGLKSIGRWRNQATSGQGVDPADTELLEVVTLMGRLARGGQLTVGPPPAAQPAAPAAARPAPPSPPAPAAPSDPAAAQEPTAPADSAAPATPPAAPAGPAPPDGADTAAAAPLMTLRLSPGGGEGETLAARLRELLGLAPGIDQITVVDGFGQGDDRTLRLRTRSLIEVMQAAARGVGGGEAPTSADEAFVPDTRSLPFRVENSSAPPVSAFTSTRYENRWYYVASDDLPSRRVLSMVMLLFEFAQPAARK